MKLQPNLRALLLLAMLSVVQGYRLISQRDDASRSRRTTCAPPQPWKAAARMLLLLRQLPAFHLRLGSPVSNLLTNHRLQACKPAAEDRRGLAHYPGLREEDCSGRRCKRQVMAESSVVESSSLKDLLAGKEQRLVFVGGKGGVGKTSTSASLAVKFADEGLSTLIVSTDPAHSLSDALDQDVSGGKPVIVDYCDGLKAMEVQTDEAIARFRSTVSGFRSSDLGLGGVAEDVLSKLGLDEFSDILENTPPGLDELLALAETLAVVRSDGDAKFQRIVFDTAPTGHTLRLLAFPQFIDRLLSALIQLRSRIGGAIALLGGLMGGVDPAAKLDAAVARLEAWQQRVADLQSLLTDPDVTDFVIVSIPSRLAVAESARLFSALVEQDVPVNHLVVNQIVDKDASESYVNAVAKEQQSALVNIDDNISPLAKLQLSRVPFESIEMRGVYALQFYASKAFGDSSDLLTGKGDRFTLVGGKGGVGKTTTSSSLAVACAEAGYNTLIVSTDPAHSLGDSLEVDLSDGEVKRIDDVLDGKLWAIEVKVDKAVEEFKRLVRGISDGGGAVGELGLADFADIFDAVPPGVDELIALAKIVALARADSYGVHFDRVIVDTAPTGHTLRLLTFPDFLERFIDRLLVLRERWQGASQMVSGVVGNIASALGGSGNGPAQLDPDGEEPKAVKRLMEFREQMRDLQALLKDDKVSEFVIVSIPTYLSLTESERLLRALRAQGISVNRGVINRIITADMSDSYLDSLRKGQSQCLEELQGLASRADVDVTQVKYFNTEMRGVFGLRVLGEALIPP